ncbi:MAG TPA: hypothetical protein VGD65_07690 [Chryseosolibacter sp.]
MNKHKKTIESFDKQFAIQNGLDKLVGGATLMSKPARQGEQTGSGPVDEDGNCHFDDSADEIIIYCPEHGGY